MNDNSGLGGRYLSGTEEWFWETIGRAQCDRGKLEYILKRYSREEICRFDAEFREAAAQLIDEPYFQYSGGLSEDAMEDVAEWVVSQGREYYLHVLQNPDEIPADADKVMLSKSFSSVADNVFWQRFGETIPENSSDT